MNSITLKTASCSYTFGWGRFTAYGYFAMGKNGRADAIDG